MVVVYKGLHIWCRNYVMPFTTVGVRCGLIVPLITNERVLRVNWDIPVEKFRSEAQAIWGLDLGLNPGLNQGVFFATLED